MWLSLDRSIIAKEAPYPYVRALEKATKSIALQERLWCDMDLEESCHRLFEDNDYKNLEVGLIVKATIMTWH